MPDQNPSCSSNRKENVSASKVPLLKQEGWTRPKENAAKHPLKGADGVVAHTHSSGMPSDRFCVSDHPAARDENNRSRLPLLFQEGSFARPRRLVITRTGSLP